jgi:hypothetical protein
MTRDETSTSVQTHLTIVQGVIERTASNSKSLKAWCITLVAAILVVVAGKDKPDYVLIALIPVVMFCILDAYYLALERGFRKAYEDFVGKLHDETLTTNDMYVVKPIGKMWLLWLRAFLSPSIWLFYVLIGVMIALAWKALA